MQVVSAVGVLGCCLAIWPGAASAQMDSREGIALQNQILELRRDLQSLQGERFGAPPPVPYRGAAPPAGSSEITAQLLDRVVTLEDEVRRLRGEVDELANQTRRQGEDLHKQIDDLNFRLGNGGPAPGAALPPPRTGPAPALLNPPAGAVSAPRSRTPELALQEGNAALSRRDYTAAETAAREVLSSGRSTPRAADAQLLLAQALAGKRDYQAAAVAYDDAYNRARPGSRAQDALLGLATSLLALNERPAACASLEKLRGEFPQPRADVRDQAASLRNRAGCR